MAIESSRATGGRVLVVQLGMTGGVTVEQSAEQSAAVRGMSARHRHVVWEIEPPNAPRGTVLARAGSPQPQTSSHGMRPKCLNTNGLASERSSMQGGQG